VVTAALLLAVRRIGPLGWRRRLNLPEARRRGTSRSVPRQRRRSEPDIGLTPRIDIDRRQIVLSMSPDERAKHRPDPGPFATSLTAKLRGGAG